MTVAEVGGTPTYHIRLIFENKGAGITGHQIIKPNDVRPFYDFTISKKLSPSGVQFETLSFKRVVDNHDYEATFCYGNLLIGTHSNGQGNWQAIKLPYVGPAANVKTVSVTADATITADVVEIPVAEAVASVADVADVVPMIPAHQVSITLRLLSYPPSYATIPLCRGEPYPQWTWAIYVFGQDAAPSGSAGQVQVCGFAMGNSHQLLSPLSSPLPLKEACSIRWTYSELSGGELWINGVSQGHSPSHGRLDTARAPKTAVGRNTLLYNSGRYHSLLDGELVIEEVREVD